MKKKFLLILLCLVSLVVVSSVTVVAEVSVGVKEGNWIEYTVTYLGSPATTYPKRIRIEINNVPRTSITADLTVERLDGSTDTLVALLLASGSFDDALLELQEPSSLKTLSFI